jgi:molecular chaperone HscC
MILGIDLGTTNSLVGVFEDQGPRLITNALGDLLTPSAISIGEDGEVIVGRAARDRLISHPQSSVASFKRLMGTNREVTLGGKSFRPEELSALVLRSLLADAQEALGESVTEAIISVPAYFGDAQRRATKIAGELAGIRIERLINEPTAAALAYGLDERLDGTTFIVLDLGGGTFDVSILEVFDGVMKVHASAGDNRLGGEDFVSMMVGECCREHGFVEAVFSPRDRAQIYAAMERLKQELSSKPVSEARFSIGDRNYEWRLTEDRFAQLSDSLLQRIRKPIERAMRDARLGSSDLAEVVLVGGASRMPIVARLVSRMFGRLPLRHVNPDEAIGRGACVAAGMKGRHRALDEVVMTDVCPYTLGVAIMMQDHQGNVSDGHFSPIIERNLTVPVSRSGLYYPTRQGQTQVDLHVYQGESPYVAHNVLLGSLQVAVPPTGNREEAAVDVRFTYDVNGVLQVEATVLATKKRFELILSGSESNWDDEEIRARLTRLDTLKIHPRQHQENIAAIARAERIYEESLGFERATIQEWLVRFQSEIERQDTSSIDRLRADLVRALDELEGIAS